MMKDTDRVEIVISVRNRDEFDNIIGCSGVCTRIFKPEEVNVSLSNKQKRRSFAKEAMDTIEELLQRGF